MRLMVMVISTNNRVRPIIPVYGDGERKDWISLHSYLPLFSAVPYCLSQTLPAYPNRLCYLEQMCGEHILDRAYTDRHDFIGLPSIVHQSTLMDICITPHICTHGSHSHHATEEERCHNSASCAACSFVHCVIYNSLW